MVRAPAGNLRLAKILSFIVTTSGRSALSPFRFLFFSFLFPSLSFCLLLLPYPSSRVFYLGVPRYLGLVNLAIGWTRVPPRSMQRRFSDYPYEDNRESNNHSAVDSTSKPGNGSESNTSGCPDLPQVAGDKPDGVVNERRSLSLYTSSSPTNQHTTIPSESQSKPMSPLESQSLSPAMDSQIDRQRLRKSHMRSPWSCSLLTLCVTLLGSLALFGIVHSYMTRQIDPQGCNTPRMLPTYIKLLGFDTEHTRFASKYGLYLYRERNVDEYSEGDIGVC